MKKQEVINLLERFPDLVDTDELIQDLFREAACDGAASTCATDTERKLRSDREASARRPAADDSDEPFFGRRC